MLLKWPIRVKLLMGLGLLLLVVGILSSSGLYTMYAYRGLVKSLSWRVPELSVAAELSHRVADLRIALSELHGLRAHTFADTEHDGVPVRVRMVRDDFRHQLDRVEDALARYRRELGDPSRDELTMADNRHEQETVRKIEAALAGVHRANRDEDWMLDDVKIGLLHAELERVQTLAGELPGHLRAKLSGFAGEVRSEYRTLIVGTWITSMSALLLFVLFVWLSWRWILVPLRVLILGSRRVASGEFDHRIHLNTHDEMSELAEALNQMTARFQAIRDDLDAQVRERTRQVVRNEQLASVGFLAAGVAHEINNPLASIAMCAESLEGRLRGLLDEDDPQHAVVGRYLRMVQDEAFRCKEITEKLLDFSRIGPAKRQDTELGELVRGVVDMVGHLGKYQQRQIEFVPHQPIVAAVNAQEIKQVVLNLLTNALDSLDDAGGGGPNDRRPDDRGQVRIELHARGDMAELTFTDNGCGIGAEVLDHVFEPFFTRRRAGQGTGLGLSISYRIVADHGGNIVAQSAGSGRGATFRVQLPLMKTDQQIANRYQAA